jgi:hypothetical protein
LTFVWREENFEWDAGDGRPLGVAPDVGDSDVTGLIGVRLEGFEGSVLIEAAECDFGHLVSSSPKCHLVSVSALQVITPTVGTLIGPLRHTSMILEAGLLVDFSSGTDIGALRLAVELI